MVMLTILLATTAPSTAGPLVILGFFVFLYLAALGVLTFLLYGLSSILAKAPSIGKTKLKVGGLSFKRAYYYASVTALVPVMLTAIQSVREIGVYQILLVCFFAVIAWIYVTNRTV